MRSATTDISERSRALKGLETETDRLIMYGGNRHVQAKSNPDEYKIRRNLASANLGEILAVNILSRDLLKDGYEQALDRTASLFLQKPNELLT